jgi:3-hydroxyisobutyrate dehydrogenase-like beta-hydroxyacid dehydrogenase
MAQCVGVIGLGNMGGAMAANLLAGGFQVVGCDPSATASRRVAEAGGEIARTPADVAARTDVIILSLPSAAVLDTVVNGPEGLVASGCSGTVVIETSTLALDTKRKALNALAAAGQILLDVPVSGTGEQARKGDLVVFASGDVTAYEKSLPALQAISRRQMHVGDFGNGSRIKFIANHLVTIHNVAAGEAFALAIKAGLDPQLVYDALRDSAGSSRMFEVRGPQMVRGRYDEPTATIRIHLKDLDIIRGFAAEVGMPLPLFSAASQYYQIGLVQGRGNEDTASVCAVAESLGGVVRSK